MASPIQSVTRCIVNRWLFCDFCGDCPKQLYLPSAHRGAFCSKCLPDVLNPPSKKSYGLDDGFGDGAVGVLKKLEAFLRTCKPEPRFCGVGRPRKNKDVTGTVVPRVTGCTHFKTSDRIRIIQPKKFRGTRETVWRLLRNGLTVEQVLTRGADAGLTRAQVQNTLKKMIRVYGVLAVDS